MIDQPQPRRDAPRRARVTNLEIQKWIARQYGFVPETEWITHCKELFGVALPDGSCQATRLNPCPPANQSVIRQAFVHFGILPKE